MITMTRSCFPSLGGAVTDHIPLVLKHEHWPQADKSAWKALFTSGDIFDDIGPCRDWSDGTRRKRRQGYGQWLSFLMRTDTDALALAPADRIDRSRVRNYIEECEARLQPKSVAGLIDDVFALALALSRERDWSWLATACKRLQTKANRRSLPPPHPVSANQVFEWSLDRIAQLDDDPKLPPLKRAIWFRQALMIGFLVARPVRRRALLAMTVDRHLVLTGDRYFLKFGAEDMKDGKDRDFPLPAALTAPMRDYVERHRLVLLGTRGSDALWINQYGVAITADGLARELPKVTERHLGVALRPHAFRHVAATSIAEFDPEHVNIIRDILGHATLNMAEKHYNRATGISSCNALQSVMEGIRKDGFKRDN